MRNILREISEKRLQENRSNITNQHLRYNYTRVTRFHRNINLLKKKKCSFSVVLITWLNLNLRSNAFIHIVSLHPAAGMFSEHEWFLPFWSTKLICSCGNSQLCSFPCQQHMVFCIYSQENWKIWLNRYKKIFSEHFKTKGNCKKKQKKKTIPLRNRLQNCCICQNIIKQKKKYWIKYSTMKSKTKSKWSKKQPVLEAFLFRFT